MCGGGGFIRPGEGRNRPGLYESLSWVGVLVGVCCGGGHKAWGGEGTALAGVSAPAPQEPALGPRGEEDLQP